MADLTSQLNGLSDREFENLTFDLVRKLGLRNLIWRTPGSDGGRDIEATLFEADPTGHTMAQKWFIECKRYKSSVSWPTLYEKVAHADALKADVLLLSTNSNPSPMCEERISTWNSERRRPVIRVIRGYDFAGYFRIFPILAGTYGISVSDNAVDGSLLELSLISQSLSQAALTSLSANQSAIRELEAANALAELLAIRMTDLANYGRFCPCPALGFDASDELKDISVQEWDQHGIRAMLSCIKLFSYASDLELQRIENEIIIKPNQPRIKLNVKSIERLEQVAMYAFCEISVSESDRITLRSRPYA